MSLHVLDTDMLTLVEEGHPVVSRRFLQQRPEDVAITVLTVEEQLSGWYTALRKAKQPKKLAWAYRRLADAVRFLARLQILTYSEPAMERYEDLRERKVKIKRMDLRIAATALEHGAILVTRNSKDFKQVPGLQIEDWTQE
jgi:tRNA(fMet)-specific endonuclease VapC